MTDYAQEFRQAAADQGLILPDEIIADSSLHRFTVPGDKSKSNNGWYVLYPDNPAAGAFGCWKRQISQAWCKVLDHELTAEEKIAYRTKMESMRRQQQADRELKQEECRAWCAEAWAKAKDATSEIPYLKLKGVNAYEVKCFKDTLLIPVRDLAGKTIHGMQFIAPNGTKKFKTGTNKTGHFFKIGRSKDNTVVICEGYATGASIHQATGQSVVVAFDCGNLFPVAQSIRGKFPEMKIVIAADDDQSSEGNPGMSKAMEAARAVAGLLAVPVIRGGRHGID